MWWNRSAEKLTLDSFAKYSYGEKNINPTQLKRSLKVKLSSLTDLLPSVNYYLQNALNLAVGEELSEKVWSKVKNVQLTIKTQKVQDDRFTYNVFPSSGYYETFSDADDVGKIRHVYDWSTAVFSYPPNIQNVVDFKVDKIRSKHTLKHDGYHLGFITEMNH